MLGLKLKHVSKSGPRSVRSMDNHIWVWFRISEMLQFFIHLSSVTILYICPSCCLQMCRVLWHYIPICRPVCHDDVKMETFPTLFTGHLCGEFTGHRWIPRTGQWRGALMFSCAWINGWQNNREAGDLIRHRPHYDAPVMFIIPVPPCIYNANMYINLHWVPEPELRSGRNTTPNLQVSAPNPWPASNRMARMYQRHGSD